MKMRLKWVKALVAGCAIMAALAACTQSIDTVLRGDNTGAVSVIVATPTGEECQGSYDFLRQTIVENTENAQNLRNEGIDVLNYTRGGLRGYLLQATFRNPQEVDRKVSAILRLGQGSPGVSDDFSMDILPVSDTPQETRWEVNTQITTNSMISPDADSNCVSRSMTFRLRMPAPIVETRGPEARRVDNFTVEWTLNTVDTFRLGAVAVQPKALPTPTPTVTPTPAPTPAPTLTPAPTATPTPPPPSTFEPPEVPPAPDDGGNLGRLVAIPLGALGAIIAVVVGIYLVMHFRQPPAQG